jgi:hypothetical protein
VLGTTIGLSKHPPRSADRARCGWRAPRHRIVGRHRGTLAADIDSAWPGIEGILRELDITRNVRSSG